MKAVTLIKSTKMKKTLLWCCIAILLFSQYPAVSLMAKGASDSQRIAEVEAFVKELYEAQTNRDVYWIRERMDDDDVIDWAVMLITLYSDDLGFQKYDNIEVEVYATSNEDYFVAVVAYDLMIEWDGEEIALPGIVSFVVWQDEDSQWRIAYDYSLSDELGDEIYRLMTSDELTDRFNSVTEEFHDILVSRPRLITQLSEVSSQVEKWVLSEILTVNDTRDENDIWDYLFGEENGILTASFNEEEDDVYIVQKGDCLWGIAEREFGDGMYWVRLYEANRDVIGGNPDLLWVGTELDLAYEEE